MENLFSAIEMGKITIKNKPTALKISTKKGSPLSKEQRLFNNLIQQIEMLQKSIETQNNNLRNIHTYYSKTISPLEKKHANTQIKLAQELAATTKKIKFGKIQLENITYVILDLCDQAFKKIAPDAQTEEFYDQWAVLTYKEEIELEIAEMKELFAQELKNNTGIDIDFSEYGDSPEEMARLQMRLMEEIAKKKFEEENVKRKTKKTKKQTANEQLETEKNNLKLKNIRAIYISLAKVLHPDTEIDEIKKLEKEVLMKKVTSAYEANDLPTLLKLELEWVSTEKNNIETITADKLNIYIQSLKEQVSELKIELFSITQNSAYENILHFSKYSQKAAEKEINILATHYTSTTKKYKENISYFKNGCNKKNIIDYVNRYIDMTNYY